MIDPKEVTKRFLKYSRSIGLNDTQLAKEMGIAKQFITQWKDNTSPIPPKRLLDFLSKHKDADANWVLFGRGSMFADPSLAPDGYEENEDNNEGGNDLNEPMGPYADAQKLLEEKDKRISEKEEYINELRQQLEFLKKLVK